MKRRLEDKVAIVVGASTRGEGVGNGKAAAIQFAREGAKVLCVGRRESATDATRDTIRSEGGQAETCVADITNAEDCQRVVDTCIQRFGKLDVLHNNVGGGVGAGGDIVDATEEEWDTAFDINVKGMFFMCKYAIPKMIEGGGGSIINISSITSIRPLGGSVAYTTAKGAVNTLTIYIARRYARYNIRANALILGYMDTPSVAPIWKDEKIREINLKQVPMRRFGSPWEGAKAAAFFASDDSSYVTGVLMPVMGGLDLRV